jgi:uncharacterized protein (TIGR02284 family)
MATSEKLIHRLNELLMLDHDAVDAYQQAIDGMKSELCRQRLREFQADHRRHIQELKACVQQYGGVPKDRRDVKGFFIKGMTAIQAAIGDHGALKAMQTNERLTNREYEQAVADATMPVDVLEILRRNRADEARHLAWINDALDRRLWEQADVGAHP